MSPTMTPMPKYRCHKEVWALKIQSLDYRPDGWLQIKPAEPGYDTFFVEPKFVPLHDPARPQVGWYFVQYEGGYKSFSPPDEFEKGYTRI